MNSASGRSEATLGRVLVVDDVAANRELIRDTLESRGWTVEESGDGAHALAQVARSAPDVILLDVAMPGMDGLEVCRRLKGDAKTARIPVIMVTNHTERADRLAGIRAGANDYLAKPIDREDLELRVKNACLQKQLADKLENSLRSLQQMERLRDSLTHMVVHDLRSPLSVISFSLETALAEPEGLPADVASSLERAGRASRVMAGMISTLLDISRLESGQMPFVPVLLDLSEFIADAVRALAEVTPERRLRAFATESSPSGQKVLADPDLTKRILDNLIGNAIKFTKPGANIDVEVTRPSAQALGVFVRDTGPGIPPESQGRIFEKFGQLGGPVRSAGVGLGLAFCKLAVERQGGRIGVESDGRSGSTFWFELPSAEGAALS